MNNRIKEIRNEKHLTLKEIGEKSGVDLTYISHLELGKRQNPSRKVMEGIAAALGSTVQEVFFPDVKTA